ncbi:MAG TPA: hypothetical protein VNG89_11490 [Vicinamibacterales bacterium]|nr:hypothetical protein [Vicinamibacterales bacterium]
MNLRSLGVSALLLISLTACDRMPSPSTPTPTPDPMSAFVGTWRSSGAAGACTAMNWTVTQVTASTATIAYTTTCAGVPVSGTANGTLNGTTMNWTTSGTAAAVCPFALAGTAAPAAVATDLNITYSGTVCGAPISGSDTLHR